MSPPPPPPVDAFDLIEFKRSRLRDINEKTEALVAAGFTFGGVAVKVNTRSLTFYQSIADLGGALTTTMIPAADDLSPALTVNLFNIGAFTGAWKQWLRDVYAAEYALKQAIRTAATREAVEEVADNR